MRVLYSPQVLNRQISYLFDGEKITVKSGELTDVFDFTGIPDGQTDAHYIQTVFDFAPILRAVKEDGILSVTLLNFIDENATKQERFPEWIEV